MVSSFLLAFSLSSLSLALSSVAGFLALSLSSLSLPPTHAHIPVLIIHTTDIMRLDFVFRSLQGPRTDTDITRNPSLTLSAVALNAGGLLRA